MRAPRLSICIATFNRADFIGETLACIVPQLTEEVELVVFDSSTDRTEQIVRGFAAQSPGVRYVKAAGNSGVDRDFDLAVEQSRGDYCWLMTDDDLLRPDAVRLVLTALSRDWSLVVVNADVWDLSMARRIERSRLPFTDDREYGPGELSRLFADVGAYATFIGCVVVRRSLWLERERSRYYGTLFIHVGVLFQAPLPDGAKVLTEPLVQIRYGNAMWRPRDFEVWMVKWPDLVWSLPPLSDEARAAVYPRDPWRDPRRLFFFRAKGTYGPSDYKRFVAPRASRRRDDLSARLLAHFPGPLANALALAYLSLSRGEKGRWLADTRASRYHPRNWLTALRGKPAAR